MHNFWFNRLYGVFDQNRNLVGKVVGNVYQPDFINWEEARKRGLTVLMIAQWPVR